MMQRLPMCGVFRPTPPRRGRREGMLSWLLATVSTHAPAQGATPTKAIPTGAEVEFRPTPPRRGRRPCCPSAAIPRGCFDPRPRAGGDTPFQARLERTKRFRPTPPRRGRPSRHQRRNIWPRVSTHAPAQGATRISRSSSAPVRSFDPRPRAGGDPRRLVCRLTEPVSTHAPAQGATGSRPPARRAAEFRPTPPRRGRRTPLYRAVFPPQSRLVLRS